ncbi:conjugative transfer protein TrbJ [alpha proteobacterium U9-1i]|nr:conjugative transfer protein TrbJ [alpha proteobacterium U9-1i]
MMRFKSRLLTSTLVAATLCVTAIAPGFTAPAAAEIVYDPTNHVENVLQAARALEQINNQLTSLANEARMLSQLNLQLSPELSQSIGAARQLLEQARGIRQNLTTITSDMQALYPNDMRGLDLDSLLRQSDRWVDQSRDSVETLMQASAASTGQLGDAQSTMNRALTASASAQGQTSAIQASTQALGVLSAQIAQLQQLQAAEARALASERLEQLAREQRAREVRRQAFPTQVSSDAPPAQPRF